MSPTQALRPDGRGRARDRLGVPGRAVSFWPGVAPLTVAPGVIPTHI